jgi:hypothetical protein
MFRRVTDSVAPAVPGFYAETMTPPLHSILQGTLHDCLGECAAAASGHALSIMQVRLASATPSKWADAVVVGVSEAGWIELAFIADGTTTIVWNHGDLSASIERGDPVAVHSVYGVLAAGEKKYSVSL